MSEWNERQEQLRKDRRRRLWKRRRYDWFAAVLASCALFGGVFGVIFLVGIFGAVGIFLGWNLGVYGLAHAVHTSVGHISLWTAFGASFAIGVLKRLVSNNEITFRRPS